MATVDADRFQISEEDDEATYEGDDEGKKSDLSLFLVIEIEIEI